jgi:alcohol dehydrogenase, propanol-preferring
MHDFEPGMVPWRMPFTLGHENAGWVDSVGDGVSTVAEGDAVAVYGPWGCGACERCRLGLEGYCGIRPRRRSSAAAGGWVWTAG